MIALLFKSRRTRRRQDAFSHDDNQFAVLLFSIANFDVTNRLLTNANAAAWTAEATALVAMFR
jgi:hypothetical protein